MLLKQKITAKEIKKQLKRYCSWRSPITITDPGYIIVSIEDIIKRIIDIKTTGDCDDYTRELEYHIRTGNPSWPVGRALLSNINGQKTNHSMVVAVCLEGVFIIEGGAVLSFLSGNVQNKVKKVVKNKDIFYNIYI